MAAPADAAPKPSSSTLIVLAWLVVLLPTAWGLEHTVQNAIKIFTTPAAAAPSSTTPAAH